MKELITFDTKAANIYIRVFVFWKHTHWLPRVKNLDRHPPEDELCCPTTLNFSMQTICIFSAVVAGALSLLAMVLNGVALYIMYKDPLNCFRRKSITVLLAALAVNDFFTGSVVSLFYIWNNIACDPTGMRSRPATENVESIIDVLAHNNGILLITCLSAERLTAVALPFYYRATASSRKTLISIFCLIAYSFVFSLLQLSTIPRGIYLTLQLHLNMTFPLFAVLVLNFGVLHILRRNRRPSCSRNSDSTDKHSSVHRLDITFTAILIVLLLLISLAPYYIMTLIEFHCSHCVESTWFIPCRQISLLFRFIHCACNPFTYSFRISECRQSLKVLFCKWRNTAELSSSDSRAVSPTQSKIFLRKISLKCVKTGEILREFVESNVPDNLTLGIDNMTKMDQAVDLGALDTETNKNEEKQLANSDDTLVESSEFNHGSSKEAHNTCDTKL